VKKIITAQIIALALFITPQVISAQTTTAQRLTPVQTRVASKEAAFKDRQQKIASREAEFKQKIQQFQDKKKADMATKINDNLAAVNAKLTANMSKNLDKMTAILNKLETRVNAVTGKDTSAAKTAIQQARTAIDSAKAAVAIQSAQDYNVVITSESKVGQDAKSVRMKLETDLKATRATVVAARQAVANAISTAMSTLGGTNGK